jgi:hypothetical protein
VTSVSIRLYASAYVRIRQHASAYVSIHQHASAFAAKRGGSVAAAYADVCGRMLTSAVAAAPRWTPAATLARARMLTYADVCDVC